MEEIIFPIPEICRFLTEETKKTTFFETEMDDKESKIADFFERSEGMYREMAWQERLQAYPTLNWITRRISTWDRIAFLLALIMNLIVAFFYPFNDDLFPWDSSYIRYSSRLFKVLMVFLASYFCRCLLVSLVCSPISASERCTALRYPLFSGFWLAKARLLSSSY